MKLVVVYWVGDGCTYSAEITQPIEYESIDAFLINLDDDIKAGLAKRNEEKSSWSSNGIFKVKGKEWEFEHSDFQERNNDGSWGIYLPEVYTLEDWFEKYKGQ